VNIGGALTRDVKAVTNEWTKYRKREQRSAAAGARAYDRYLRGRSRCESIRDIAFEVMEEAYMQVSANGTLPASARQIMYKARPLILARIEKEKLNDQYFTQTLLPDYMRDNPQMTANWDVVFDARGHLFEPHTGREVQLGTLAVRAYLLGDGAAAKQLAAPQLDTQFPTCGAQHRFTSVLFIEKEGFMPLLERAQIAARYDVAIMSTKGVSTTAARRLVDGLRGVRFFVLHDFDKAGFSILSTLRESGRRYHFKHRPDVVDLGLRLSDVESEGLESEPVFYKELHPTSNLRKNGATQAEISFLYTGRGRGQRVELNAFASDQFIAWLERKLQAHSVDKVVPDDDTLTAAYRRAFYVRQLNAEISKADEQARQQAESAALPKGLRKKVTRLLAASPALSWDDALTTLAAAQPAKRRGRKAA
jgi:hypothetical protein